jgi:hypothetical protein
VVNYPSNKMWTGTVSFKSIETGEPVRKDKTMIASTRQALENLYLFDFELMDKNTVYMTVWIDSPIGTFFVDLMGWQAIHNDRKMTDLESND